MFIFFNIYNNRPPSFPPILYSFLLLSFPGPCNLHRIAWSNNSSNENRYHSKLFRRRNNNNHNQISLFHDRVTVDYDCRRRLLQAQHRDRRSPGLWKRILQRRSFVHHYESCFTNDFFDPTHNFDTLLRKKRVKQWVKLPRSRSFKDIFFRQERSILLLQEPKPETKQNTKIL